MTPGATGACRDSGARVATPRVARALLRRDVNVMSGVAAALGALLAVAAAFGTEHGGEAAALPLIGRMLRRFDLTVLAAMALTLVLRTAIRIEEDHRAGWSGPLFAAGAARWRYGAALALAGLITPAFVFAVVAAAFAMSVRTISGAGELLSVLPATLGGGLLVLGTYGVCAAAAGLAIRHILGTVLLVALLTLAPAFLSIPFAFTDAALPTWLLPVVRVAPLIRPPSGLADTMHAVIYIVVGSGLIALISQRVAGRRP